MARSSLLGRGLLAGLVVSLTLFGLALGAAPASADGLTFRFDGGGNGHGLGMGQWGAKAQADAGRSPTDILQTYYKGTTVGTPPGHGSIRVGLLQDVATVTIRSAGTAPGYSDGGRFAFGWGNGAGQAIANPNEMWEVRAVSDTAFRLFKNGASASDQFSGPLHVDYDYTGFHSIVSVAQTGHRYRHGFFDIVHRSG